MGKIKTALKLLRNGRGFQAAIADNITSNKLFQVLPDTIYLKLIYRLYVGKKLNLKNPKTYSEKLQWLKIHDRKPHYTKFVDKYDVKRHVANLVGEEYIIPNIGVWESFDEIDFDSLPNQFVLKCTHDSGSVVICKDKNSFDYEKAKAKLSAKFNTNLFYHSREWPYKNVKPRILAEAYMEDSSTQELRDYKFYCFKGEAKFLYVSRGLSGSHNDAEMSFYDLNWEKTPFQRDDYRALSVAPQKPVGFETMIKLANRLSAGIPFLRVDLYEVNGRVYFSEMTFYPGSGFTPFASDEWEDTIGGWITLPIEKDTK